MLLAAWRRSSNPLFCGFCKSGLCSNCSECIARYHFLLLAEIKWN